MLRGLPGQGHEDRVHAGAVHRDGSGGQAGVAQGHEHLGGHRGLAQRRLQVGALVDGRRGVTGHPLDDGGGSGLVLGGRRRQHQRAAAHPVLELIGGALGDEPSGIDDADPVSQAVGLLQVLSGQQDRRAALHQGTDDVPHLLTRTRVQTSGGLVEEDERGTGDERDRQVQAAPHPTGVTAHPLAACLGQAEGGQQLLGPLPRPTSAKAQQAPEEAQVLRAGERLIDAGVLSRHPDEAAHRVALADDVVPQDHRPAPGGGQQGGHHAQRRRLAGTVGAEQAVDDAGGDLQVQAVDGGEGAEGAGQAIGPDGRCLAR